MKPLLSVIDHLVYITSNLDDTITDLEKRFGVRAAVGGQHPRWGTRNALLALGPEVYLEIMGPDGSPKDPERRRPFGIDRLDRPCLATWVAHSNDLQRIVSLATAENVDLGEVLLGSRSRPDGSLLQWTMTDLIKDRESGTIPYFIDWGDSPHPAATAPKGCTLSGLRVFHPEAERITHVLWKLGIDLPVGKGAPSLEATIESPKGTIDLS